MPEGLGSLESLAGKRVLVMGLGRFGGGVGVTRWLVGQGAVVTVTDAAGAETLQESVAKLAGLPVTFKLGGHDVADFLAADLLILNPAVDKRTSEPVKAALAAGIPFTTEMNLFLERCRGFTIGVTGSVGKSTTTTLIHEALKAGLGDCQLPIADCRFVADDANRQSAMGNRQSLRVFLGGNIGKSLLSEVGEIRAEDIVVLELSSFMLEDTPRIGWSPHVAVVTNVYPNHLDRHGTMAEYAGAKQNILRYQKPGDVAILNNDHELVARWAGLAEKVGARVVTFTTRGPSALELVLPGEHNQSNARAALAVLEALPAEVRGVLDREAALQAIREFAGLSHRLQLVHTVEMGAGRVVRFFNDSKATTPDASITAVQAFAPRSAVFIVGGYDKHIDMGAFTAALAERAAGVVGIGQTGAAMVAAVGEGPGLKTYAGTLEAAVREGAAFAEREDGVRAVVLSPASASWDQFPNYEKRGELFISSAKGVAEVREG